MNTSEIAVSKVAKVSYIPLDPSELYIPVDTSKVSWLKWIWMTPSYKIKKGTILYSDGWHWHTKEYLASQKDYYLCIFNDKLYRKAVVKLAYLDGTYTVWRFNTNDEAYLKYTKLCETFGLDKVIKYENNCE